MTSAAFSAEELEAGRRFCARDIKFALGVAELVQLPPADRAEIAFCGRSNVGKSSLINAVVNRKNLARASAEPGRTRELNYFDLAEGQMWLVDLPGFGYAKVSRSQSQKWTKLTQNYLRGRVNLRRVFLLIDSRRGIMPTDIETMKMLDTAAIIYRIVLTKADKVKKSELEKTLEAISLTLKTHPAAYPDVSVTSSETGQGLAELRAVIASLVEG